MEFFFPHINTAIAGLIPLLVVLYYVVVLSRSKTSKSIPPPEAGGGWPIIGHLHLLGSSDQLPHISLGVMADKYGPIFTLRFGMHRAVVVSNSEIAKECFTTYGKALLSRPKLLASYHLGYNYAMFGFTPDGGTYWRELRKIVSINLLGSRQLGLLEHVRVSEIKTSVKKLHKLWTERETSSRHVLVEMQQWFADLTMNVMVKIVVGKRYFGVDADGDGKEGRRFQKVFKDFFYFMGLFLVGDAIPFLQWLDLGGHEKAMKEAFKEMESLISEFLEEHRRRREPGGGYKGDQDFMDAMLSTLQGRDFADVDAETINKATCLNMIVAGGDTPSVMLTWALSLLMNNRHVLKKAQEELDLHVGKERQVEVSDISKLFYLQAIIKETLRLHTAQLSGPREFTEDCTINGYYIPKGTRLILNLWKIHRDPKIWADPLEFRPERFLTTHKHVDVNGLHFDLIPFGVGRRACPGIEYSIQMLNFVLATLLHGFEISTPDNVLVNMTESAGLTNKKATPLEVLVAPRLAPTLYE